MGWQIDTSGSLLITQKTIEGRLHWRKSEEEEGGNFPSKFISGDLILIWWHHVTLLGACVYMNLLLNYSTESTVAGLPYLSWFKQFIWFKNKVHKQLAANIVCFSTTSTISCHEWRWHMWRASVENSEIVKGWVEPFLKCKQRAGQGQTVNSQSRPFKCQLSWKQVQKRGIWTVAEQPTFSDAEEQQRATPWSRAAPLKHWKLQFKQTGV